MYYYAFQFSSNCGMCMHIRYFNVNCIFFNGVIIYVRMIDVFRMKLNLLKLWFCMNKLRFFIKVIHCFV